MKKKFNRDNATPNTLRVIEELDNALADCSGAPGHIVNQIILSVLDGAQREKRLKGLERLAALDYLEDVHGYTS